MGYQWIFSKDDRYVELTPDLIKSAIDYQRMVSDPRIIAVDYPGDVPLLPILTRVRYLFPPFLPSSMKVEDLIRSIGSTREGVILSRGIIRGLEKEYYLMYTVFDAAIDATYTNISFQWVTPVNDIRGETTFLDMIERFESTFDDDDPSYLMETD